MALCTRCLHYQDITGELFVSWRLLSSSYFAYRTTVKVRKGRLLQKIILTSYSQNFHEFVDSLYERHVDMSKAHISKAEIALWGLVSFTYTMPSALGLTYF